MREGVLEMVFVEIMMNPPNKGACSMYMMNRNRQMRGRVCLIDDESESRNAEHI